MFPVLTIQVPALHVKELTHCACTTCSFLWWPLLVVAELKIYRAWGVNKKLFIYVPVSM